MCFFPNWSSCFVILCWFLLYNEVKQLYIHMYPFPLGPHFHPPSYPSGSSQSTVLSLCTMQRVSTGCLCYVWQCTYVSPNSSHPPQPHPHISSLHLCLYSCRTNRFICTTFLDSTYINCYIKKKKKTQHPSGSDKVHELPNISLAGLLHKEQAQLGAQGMCWSRAPLLSRALGFSSLHSVVLPALPNVLVNSCLLHPITVLWTSIWSGWYLLFCS